MELYLPETKRKKPKPPYRKPETVKVLERMADEAARKKHPGVPEHVLAPRKYRDDSANALTKCIVDYITLSGGFATRINSTGVFDTRLQRYRPGTTKKGIADIMGTCQGISLHIEVKSGNDRQSEAQKKIQSEVELSGGLYYIARNFTDFKLWFDNVKR
jgi:hypothetical protein